MTTFVAHKRDSKSPGLHYPTGGTGRESYITANNGGYSVANGPTVFERGGSLNAGKGGAKPPAPGGRAQVRYYRPDGRGRDTYISNDFSSLFDISGNKAFIERPISTLL